MPPTVRSHGVEPPIDGQPSLAWLERVNRLSLLSQLVASTLHDMNNAMQVIGGGLELLRMPPVDVVAVSRAIGSKTDRVNVLLRDLSHFMRDPGGGLEPVNLRQLAEDTLAMRQFALGRIRATRTVEGEAVVPALRREVLQVLLNLVVNAEVALRGVPSPVLRIVIAPTPGGATLRVEDNGPGVPADLQARLFEPRVPATSGPVERLGIGLAVSQALAARQHGSLSYAPGSPTGATFTLALNPSDC